MIVDEKFEMMTTLLADIDSNMHPKYGSSVLWRVVDCQNMLERHA
jgi:hypothetical protein